ncbi:MAG: Hpt domain-containing protein, partial [Desulfotomaculaceae bacterium]|nr:Hpt domain-containing protein [Desulfotomaculaceae bacterium]
MFDSGLEEKLEMVRLFVIDSRELLDDVEPKIIEMEEKALAAGEADEDILNSIFRLFHSLKGSASFLDLQTITSVTHEAETLLDIFRNRKATVSPEHVDLLIRTSDFIRKMVDTVEQQMSDEGFEREAAEIISDLKKTIANTHAEVETGAPAALDKTSGGSGTASAYEPAPAANPQASGICEPESGAGRSSGSGCGCGNGKHYGCKQDPNKLGETGLSGMYTPSASLEEMDLAITPEMTGRFVEESRELLDEAESTLLALEKTPQDKEYADRAFRALHSFKGNAGFFGYP